MSRLFLTLVCAAGCAQLVFAFSVAQSSSSESKTTLYYGFAGQDAAPEYRGKFVRVESRNHNTDVSCERIGLLPGTVLSYAYPDDGSLEYWNNLKYTNIVGGYLTAGITDFRVYKLPYTYVDWMSRLADDSPLTALALPGSYLSGSASFVSGFMDFAKSQKYSVIFQLLLGVRVLDIRVMRDRLNGGLSTYINYQSGNKLFLVEAEHLNSIVSGIKMFLENYPTETVIFKASEYVSTTEDELVRELTAALGDRFVNPPTRQAKQALRVGDVRGKVLFLPIEHTESNFGPNGKAGSENWDDVVSHLNQIPERRDVFNFFPVLLKPNQTSIDPDFMAQFNMMRRLTVWLQTPASEKIGIVETLYNLSDKEISKLIGQIVEKNSKLGFLLRN